MTEKKLIGLVNFNPANKENQTIARFEEEANKLGYQTKIFNHYEFCITFKAGKIELFYQEEKFNPEKYLCLIPTVTMFECLPDFIYFLNCANMMGVPIINNPEAICLTKNKTLSMIKLAKADFPVIPSAINYSSFNLKPILEFINDDDFICKTSKGSLGRGVAILNSRISLISTFELMTSNGIRPSSIIFQKYIKEAQGKDTRIIVVGDKVIASMQRISGGIDFRSNLCGTGTGNKVDCISKEIADMAISAVKTLELDYGGVDILETKEGPMIIEVNPNPGLKIENVTGINISKEIIKHAISQSEK